MTTSLGSSGGYAEHDGLQALLAGVTHPNFVSIQMRSLAEEIRNEQRRRFFDSPQTCEHNRKVYFWRPGDWYHADDGTMCDAGPEAPPPIECKEK